MESEYLEKGLDLLAFEGEYWENPDVYLAWEVLGCFAGLQRYARNEKEEACYKTLKNLKVDSYHYAEKALSFPDPLQWLEYALAWDEVMERSINHTIKHAQEAWNLFSSLDHAELVLAWIREYHSDLASKHLYLWEALDVCSLYAREHAYNYLPARYHIRSEYERFSQATPYWLQTSMLKFEAVLREGIEFDTFCLFGLT